MWFVIKTLSIHKIFNEISERSHNDLKKYCDENCDVCERSHTLCQAITKKSSNLCQMSLNCGCAIAQNEFWNDDFLFNIGSRIIHEPHEILEGQATEFNVIMANRR